MTPVKYEGDFFFYKDGFVASYAFWVLSLVIREKHF